MEILESYWVIRKVYFKAKLVDNFKEKYIKWRSDIDEDCHAEDLDFASNLENKKYVMLYKHPVMTAGIYSSKESDAYADYFEKEDDRRCIPRELFEPYQE